MLYQYLIEWYNSYIYLCLLSRNPAPFHSILFSICFSYLCVVWRYNQTTTKTFVLRRIYIVFIREKRLKELLYQQIFPWLWLRFLLQLVHLCIYIGTDFSIYTMYIAYLYRDMESEASNIVRTNFVGIVGDVRRDMEGHHYRYLIDIRSCGCIYTYNMIELKVNY